MNFSRTDHRDGTSQEMDLISERTVPIFGGLMSPQVIITLTPGLPPVLLWMVLLETLVPFIPNVTVKMSSPLPPNVEFTERVLFRSSSTSVLNFGPDSSSVVWNGGWGLQTNKWQWTVKRNRKGGHVYVLVSTCVGMSLSEPEVEGTISIYWEVKQRCGGLKTYRSKKIRRKER